MIRECVGFVENYAYLKDKTLQQKPRDLLCEFLVEDILLADKTRDHNEEQKICIFFPFVITNGTLSLSTEKYFVKVIENRFSEKDFSGDELNRINQQGYTKDELSEVCNIIKNTDKHLKLIPIYEKQDMNKLIGAAKSILSPVIYTFKINKKKESFEKAIGRFLRKDKLGKCKYTEKQSARLIWFNSIASEIKKIVTTESELNALREELSKKESPLPKKKKRTAPEIFFIALLPSLATFRSNNILPEVQNYRSVYSFLRVEFLKSQSTINAQEFEGYCMCCTKQGKLDAPMPFSSYSSKKPFLEHKTRNTSEKNILVCGLCALLYRLFFDYLSINEIKIMPLFIDPNLQKKQITLISEKGFNSFEGIFSQLQNNNYEFYLFLLRYRNEEKKPCRELFFYDYIFNYHWILKEFRFWDNFNVSKNINRTFLESRIKAIIGIVDYFPYFEKLDAKENWKKYLFNLLQEKLFNYVYRNISQLTREDFINLFVIPVEYYAISKPESFFGRGIISDSINLWFNQKIFLKETEEDIMKITELQNKEPDFSVEVWAFNAGRFYRFLVEKSKAEGPEGRAKKSLELEAVIAISQIKRLRLLLGDKFGNRSHAITEIELKNLSIQSEKLLATNNFDEEGFREVKPYFYAGYVYQLKK